MLFNSLQFLVFFPTVFLLYWFIFNKNLRIQNALIVISSYYFYACWDYRFLGLIIFSSVVDYVCAIKINHRSTNRKGWLYLSIISNLGLLFFFKYYNFFTESFIRFSESLGYSPGNLTLNVILPVGISFYTFQTLSYTIDVYRNKINATNDLVSFLAFVSFFPQLVAGPIERASHLLPQFQNIRNFDYKFAAQGMRLILWGLFKKVVIADNCAIYANEIFSNYDGQPSIVLMSGTFYFALQIYGDFSGYSDMAIGMSRLLGFDLMKNFKTPYFSEDIAVFWRNWHISLTTWFRDYLYIPLGGSRVPKTTALRNIFIVFIVSGLWHGANWTFIFWGLINALYFVPNFLKRSGKEAPIRMIKVDTVLSKALIKVKMFRTFILVCFAWIFFRAENIWVALDYLHQTLTNNYLANVDDLIGDRGLVNLIILFVLLEWNIFRKDNFQYVIEEKGLIVRHFFYIFITYLILTESAREKVDFIYFQF